ncbi:sugar transferase [Cohnella zeiphila]|uniref:Sugar transferase n=1 Tax=Cohnella zeiphila TaxID=2761120 RepID=A0A7X0VX37_9BACL|nr:sugar transferase [Cohnella zeiphila]MBB6733057.1 sugar transferase [Cohnella zeiphila]
MSRLFRLSRSTWFIAALDFVLIFLCYLAAYEVRFRGDIPVQEFDSFMRFVPLLGAMGIGTYYLFNLYNFSSRFEYSRYFYNLVVAHVMVVIELIFLNFWVQHYIIPRSIVLLAIVLQPCLMAVFRMAIFSIQAIGNGKKRAVLIVKDSESDFSIIEKVILKGDKWMEVVRIEETAKRVPVPGEAYADIDLFLLSPGVEPGVKAEFMRFAGRNHKEILLIPEFYELFLMKAESQQIDDMLVYSIIPPRLSPLEKMIKRAFDLLVASLLLIASSPVMLLFWILIPLTSPGKALYRQERVGIDERPFMVLKFRSMVNDAENVTGPVLAGERDARITKLGRLMRATRIDELPQLFNVLRGEMSIVGPRPEREFFINQFKQTLPHYPYRFMVKPGLTGLAQVMGNYSTLSSDKLRYDLMYINNYSLLFDLKILFQTVVVVLQREQSKGVSEGESPVGQAMKRLLGSQKEMAASHESPTYFS